MYNSWLSYLRSLGVEPETLVGICVERSLNTTAIGLLGILKAGGVLSKHPGVRQAAVIAREDIPGDKRLVAYIVSTLSKASRTAIVPELRRLIQAKLPEYMLPSAFVVLDGLPLTPNGKLDRRSLPAPNPDRPILEQEFVTPRTSVEIKLAQIWSQVSHIDPIGLKDNFFELRGYGQCKWVAEKLWQKASSEGIPIAIYRPGTITGHSTTGAYNADQTLGRLLKSFIAQGCAPNLDIEFDLTPVDYVSQAIVYLSRQQESLGKSFHLVSPQCLQMGELIDRLRSLDYPIEQMDYPQWESKMQNVILSDPENVLSPILPFLIQKIPGTQLTYLEASSFTQRLDCENAVTGLAKSGINCPPPDKKLLRLYLNQIEQFPFRVAI